MRILYENQTISLIYTIQSILIIINTSVGFLRFTWNKYVLPEIGIMFHLVPAYHILITIYRVCLFVIRIAPMEYVFGIRW